MKFLKKILKKVVIIFLRTFSRTKIGSLIFETNIEDVMEREKCIIHNNCKMNFAVPNKLNRFRIDTFTIKEPETLEWIDSLPNNSTLWDIGANIGLYSVYAAKARNCKVFAFEPSIFNLESLARNIYLNCMQEKITIVPIALSDKIGFNKMRFTTTQWGGALSSFDKNVGWDGNPINDIFSYKTFGCSMDQAISILKLPQPDYIKMDVDGIEHFILGGGKNVLGKVKSILLEINDDFKEQSEESKIYLVNSGFKFHRKLRSEEWYDSTTEVANGYNQIWVK